MCISRNTNAEKSGRMTYKMRNGMSNISTVNAALFMGTTSRIDGDCLFWSLT